MDDRKKRIDELIKNSQESRSSLDVLLEKFGEKLYIRTKEMDVSFEDINQYNLYLQDITEFNTSIVKIEENNRRFRELEEAIAIREQDEKERAKELAVINKKLGKALLENSSYDDYTSLFKEQADSLKAKLGSLETRIGELDNKEGGNVFTWIGKSAQGLVLKTFLSKAQDNQEQLYLNIGERYNNREAVSSSDDVAVVLKDLNALRDISRTVQDELSSLKDEKRIITAEFGIEGNPQKQIQSVRNRIAKVNESLAALYKTFGAQVAGIDENITPNRKYFIDTIVTAEDGEIIGRASRLNQSIADNEKSISKLKASLAIDEEKNKISKFQRMIMEKKGKITELEKAIADMEEDVRDCESCIQELEKQL